MKRTTVNRIVGLLIATAIVAGMVFGARALIQYATRPPLVDARTGQRGDDFMDFVQPDAQIVIAVYFRVDCDGCTKFAPEIIDAWAEMKTTQFGHKVAVVFINAAQQSKADVLKWMENVGMPQGIPVLLGASNEATGIPEGLTWDPNVQAGFKYVPALFIAYEWWGGQWRTIGFYDGEPKTSSELVMILNDYFWTRMLYGF